MLSFRLSLRHDGVSSLYARLVTFGHDFLRRCGNVSLLVLDGGLLEAVGDLLGAVLLLGGAVDGLGLGLEAVDLGLSLGDVLENLLVIVISGLEE